MSSILDLNGVEIDEVDGASICHAGWIGAYALAFAEFGPAGIFVGAALGDLAADHMCSR